MGYLHSLVVVINDAEKLTKDAQHALRRTMEKYSANIRFIFCCSSIGRVISPIKSRCLLFRFPSPTDEQVQLAALISPWPNFVS
jgi:replication factor C subunit 3/5